MSDIDLEVLRRQVRGLESQERKAGGGDFAASFDFILDDREEYALPALLAVVVAGLLLHAWLSGNWSLVGGLALLFVVVGFLSELPAIVTGIFEFTQDNYEDIKAWILFIPAVLGALVIFTGALNDGTNLFVALLISCFSFGAFAALGQLVFWLMERAVEYWWVTVVLLVFLLRL